MANLLNLAVAAAILGGRPKPRDPNGCYSCGDVAIIRDPRQPHTVRCGACGHVQQILVKMPSVNERVATDRARHGGGPRVVE